MNMSRLLKSLGCLLLLLITDRVSAQTQIQTEFIIKRGWIYLDYPKRGIAFDSVADPSRQNIPTHYTQLGEYKVVLYGAGAVYVYKPGQKTINRAAYPDPRQGGRPAKLIVYAGHKLLLLSTTDGYIRPRRILLVEVNLEQGIYQVIDQAKEITSVAYSSDLNQISFLKNGIESKWSR